MLDMTNHYEKSVDHVQTVNELRLDLADAYRAHASAATVAGLHQSINVSLKLADVHATLAVAQGLHDLANFGQMVR